MDEFCNEHSNCSGRIERLEQGQSHQWKKLDNISTKLNIILGGILIAPFLISVFMLLMKTGGKG